MSLTIFEMLLVLSRWVRRAVSWKAKTVSNSTPKVRASEEEDIVVIEMVMVMVVILAKGYVYIANLCPRIAVLVLSKTSEEVLRLLIVVFNRIGRYAGHNDRVQSRMLTELTEKGRCKEIPGREILPCRIQL